MPLSLRGRLIRSMLKMTIRDREAGIAELRAGGGLGSMPEKMVLKGARIEEARLDGIPAEWVVPPRRIEGKAILHLHGGGYISGSARSYHALTAALANCASSKVVVPDYRLAPEHPFPAALEDCLKAWRALESLGYKAENLIISGDSAGGGLALATVMALRDAGERLPAAVFCMSPWTDLRLKNPSCVAKAKAEALLRAHRLGEWASHYAGGADLDDPGLSPINGDFHGLPPMLVQVGSEEILLDDAILLAQKASSAGVAVELRVWPGLWHVWQILGDLVPESRATFAEAALFIQSFFGQAK